MDVPLPIDDLGLEAAGNLDFVVGLLGQFVCHENFFSGWCERGESNPHGVSPTRS